MNKAQKIKIALLFLFSIFCGMLALFSNNKAPADKESMNEVLSIINEAKTNKNGDALLNAIKDKQQDGISNADVYYIKNAYENWKVETAIQEAEASKSN